MAVPSHRFRRPREIQVPARWCCFDSSFYGWCSGSPLSCWVVLLGLLLLPFFVFAVFPFLFGGVLLDFFFRRSFQRWCYFSPSPLGGALFTPLPF